MPPIDGRTTVTKRNALLHLLSLCCHRLLLSDRLLLLHELKALKLLHLLLLKKLLLLQMRSD